MFSGVWETRKASYTYNIRCDSKMETNHGVLKSPNQLCIFNNQLWDTKVEGFQKSHCIIDY